MRCSFASSFPFFTYKVDPVIVYLLPCRSACEITTATMSRGAFRKLVVHYWACISVLLLHCHCQFYEPYEKLPLSSFESFNGTFDFPSGETQMFDEGADMTIRWTTEFLAVNLYVVYNASANPPSVGKQRQLSSEYPEQTK